MTRVVFALAVLVGAGMLLVGFWLFAVRTLEDLPAREALRSAPATAVQTPTTAPRQAAEVDRPVRYVEKAGIASPRPEGPLTRDDTPNVPSAQARSAAAGAASSQSDQPTLPPEPASQLYKLVVIESASTIDARTRTIKLAHIDAPDVDAACARPDGRAWPCGARARTALRRLVRRRALDCFEIGDAPADDGPDAPEDDGPMVATCKAGTTDLSSWLVEQGWATPSDDAPDAYRALHAEAKEAGRGMFAPDGR